MSACDHETKLRCRHCHEAVCSKCNRVVKDGEDKPHRHFVTPTGRVVGEKAKAQG